MFSLGDWGEDEFDRAAARKVKNLFEDVDSWMFEQKERVEGSLSQTSRKECVEWGEKFLHCRTLGRQLMAPKDGVGYEVVTADAFANRPATGSFLIDVTETDMAAVIPDHLPAYGLSVSGKNLKPIEVSPSQITAVSMEGDGGEGRGKGGLHESSGVLRADMSHLVEEIFSQDGQIEEYLAYDARKFYSSTSVTAQNHEVVLPTDAHLHHRRGRHRHHHRSHAQPPYRTDKSGLPPITPTGCLRDSIVSGIFDLLWSKYISWIQHVLQVT